MAQLGPLYTTDWNEVSWGYQTAGSTAELYYLSTSGSSSTASTGTYYVRDDATGYYRPVTDQEMQWLLEQERRRHAEYVERMEREREQRREAEIRAQELLRSIVSDAEWKELWEKNYITVKTKKGRFRIYAVPSYNVHRVNLFGREDKAFCAVPSNWVPMYDQMAAQYLFLKKDPAKLLEVANSHYL